MKTAIIIPCYNEETRINKSAFINFIQSSENYHLCFVNDGSKDKTLDVLKGIQQTDQQKVSVIDMKRNSGKAAAVRAGARYLHTKSDIEHIGFIDADLSTDFEDFIALDDTLKRNATLKMVFGSRAKDNDGGGIKKDPLRAVFSKVIKMCVYLILGLPIQDTQCGAKVFKKELIPVIYAKSFLSKWLFDVELFIRLKKYMGGKTQVMQVIHEQALNRWVHVDDSKLGLKDSLEIPLRLMIIWFNYNVLSLIPVAASVEESEVFAEIYPMPMAA
ncbi:dolichyl-phosphate beta-glucosyltransferase [Leeuwenhoekiella polynyae]|uniref:dolichyl-phosphate beta-glucosyltransferase n=1 Tax=Leeuwenhoekiella polynyae TaxID=1550906 RepID=A0A4V1KQK7_9FLAO|nr:dolichyl-phosphate beta-glucosyltransferase [Leeuwenhoekiella polynyae]RXG21752.1 glycosyl transferase family 2 [Leeuwenhoekiella polynyae]|tara:strand:- start:370 stop:1188 length:819 start_codon:yes stop_codon:yes gene_type:complete